MIIYISYLHIFFQTESVSYRESRVFKHLLSGFAIVVSLLFTQTTFGQGVSVEASASGGVSDGVLVSSHVFFYSDKSALGDDTLKDGGAMFNRFDLQWNFQSYFSGIGLFYEQDKFGKSQSDTITGLIVELVAGSFFLKIMPGAIQQEFTGRSFTKRSGDYLAYEAGIRGDLYGGFFFYEVALHRRTQTISQEDGRKMLDKYTKTETMPMLGLGVSI